MATFHVPERIARELIEHAQAEYPKECCGLLVGPPGEVRELHKLTNIDPDPVMRYNADPKELKRIWDALDAKDWGFVAIYHSHTHSPAVPSQTDIERAGYPDAVYVLVSLADRGNPDLRAWNILEGKIEELPVVRADEVTK